MATGMLRFYDRNEGRFVSTAQLLDWLRAHRRADGMIQPVLFWGSAGVGKTARVLAYCRERGFKCNIYLPAHDASGENLAGERSVADGETVRRLPAWLPRESDPPGVLFIDEINRASQAVQDALLELVGAGTLSLAGYRLPEHWQIVGAANPADLEHAVHDIDNAMIDRFLHVAPGHDQAAWSAWADGEEGVHPAAVDFALAHASLVEFGEPGFPQALVGRISPTPRSIANLGYLLEDDMDEGLLRLLALGMLGREGAERFCSYFPRWREGERPLRFEQVLRGEYEEALSRWEKSPDRAGLVEGTGERVVAGLMGRAPNEDIALLVARYLAFLSAEERARFFEALERSAPDWQEPLERLARRIARQLGRPYE
jgi:hypothetical protein